MMAETRKILGDESIPVSATCVRVPVYNAHSESVNVQTREDLSPERCRELLDSFPGVTVVDDPAAGRYPMPIDAAGPRRRVRRPHPARPLARALPQHVGGVGQPAQGRRHQRRAARRADRRARPDRVARPGARPASSPSMSRLARDAGRARGARRASRRRPAPTPPPAPRDPYAEATRPDQVVLTWRSGVGPGCRSSSATRSTATACGSGEARHAAVRGRVAAGEHALRVRRAGARAGWRERRTRPSRGSRRPPSRAFEIGPYLQQLTPTGGRDRLADLRARHDRAPLRPGGRPARGRRARRRADAGATRCRCAAFSPEPTTATSGSPTASSASCPPSARPSPGRTVLVRRDRRLRHRDARRAREPAPPVGRPGGRPRDHDRRQRADLRHRGRVPAASCSARCAT